MKSTSGNQLSGARGRNEAELGADDPRVVEALLQYQAALDAGEVPDLDTWLGKHPELADVLTDCLEVLRFVEGAAPQLQAPAGARKAGSANPEPEIVPEIPLGDFRIVRELGRGGMGVVYEAQQLSLGRRVALKVLPFAAALDVRQLQRFKNEAQAAAQLHHTHIVPVYAVGCDRGVHYYAMQFIDGQSLAEIIRSLRGGAGGSPAAEPEPAPSMTRPLAALSTERSASSPAYYRAVAQLGVQAAEALEHAHQIGIVHRDIKPANLLVDVAGQLWVTDFGLARCRTDPGITATGNVLGTLRYMSPEQALAKRGLVDHRSDIYSLGITLYEALTLEPAYPGVDREEVLRQIANGDPRSPRRLKPSVPVELETIVLKASAREPEQRYATAQELADDLRRFLEHRPILAVRPSLRERLWKWARRHQALLATAGMVAGLLILGLVVSTVLIWHEKGKADDALALARSQEQAATKQRLRAEANFQRALRGATQILMQLDEKPGSPPLTGEALHRAVVEQGIQFFHQFIDEEDPDPAIRFQSAEAYRYMAMVHAAQKDLDQTRATMQKCEGLLKDLLTSDPDHSLYRQELVSMHYLMGLLEKSFGHPLQAHKEYALAMELCPASPPPGATAEALNTFAWILVDCPEMALRDPERAVLLARESVNRAPEEPRFWNTLGVAQYRAGNWSAAQTALERSTALGAGGTAHDWFFLAMTHARQGHMVKARQWLARAVEHQAKLPFSDEALERYRAEAESLIPTKDPKK